MIWHIIIVFQHEDEVGAKLNHKISLMSYYNLTEFLNINHFVIDIKRVNNMFSPGDWLKNTFLSLVGITLLTILPSVNSSSCYC